MGTKNAGDAPYPINLLFAIFGERCYDEHNKSFAALLENQKFIKAMAEAVSVLDTTDRQITEYFFKDCLAFEEISQKLNMSVDDVLHHYAYALRVLRHPSKSRHLTEYIRLI